MPSPSNSNSQNIPSTPHLLCRSALALASFMPPSLCYPLTHDRHLHTHYHHAPLSLHV